MFTGAVVLDLVRADQLLSDGYLDLISDHGNLHRRPMVANIDAILARDEASPQRIGTVEGRLEEPRGATVRRSP